MNIKSWNLPVKRAQQQPLKSKAKPPLKPSFESYQDDDDYRFERGYN